MNMDKKRICGTGIEFKPRGQGQTMGILACDFVQTNWSRDAEPPDVIDHVPASHPHSTRYNFDFKDHTPPKVLNHLSP